jgi:hypothetical protein
MLANSGSGEGLFSGSKMMPSSCFHMGGRVNDLSGASFTSTLVLFMRVPLSWSKCL